ncbi:MAG: M28 family peptidase [Bacteroidia bacterium]|nr:M28 family peptidase [Bacteroidia bacterium]
MKLKLFSEWVALFLVLVMCLSCTKNKKNQEENHEDNFKKQDKNEVKDTYFGEFNADSAYFFLEKQVSFGPRVPNTPAHNLCGAYLVSTLSRFADKVYEQKSTVTVYNGSLLPLHNIIGVFNPTHKRRILLTAHWDSRHITDQDNDKSKAVLGANDGASGVAVLLEIARLLKKYPIQNIGIDILLNDAEDYGAPDDYKPEKEDTYCLGSQYWAKNPHIKDYTAEYAIVLDMVGGKNATFYREQLSDEVARALVDKIWNKAAQLGYGIYFLNEKGTAVIDDHLYIHKIANIPAIDIIDHNPSRPRGFPEYWHTQRDDLSNIDKNTLKAVGTVVYSVLREM